LKQKHANKKDRLKVRAEANGQSKERRDMLRRRWGEEVESMIARAKRKLKVDGKSKRYVKDRNYKKVMSTLKYQMKQTKSYYENQLKMATS
jgi:hypothetical protein